MGNVRIIPALSRGLRKIIGILLVNGLLCACSSVQYVDTHDLKYLYGSDSQLSGLSGSDGKRFGALRFKGKEEDASDDRYVMLTKHRNVYAAETLMFDNSTTSKKNFDRGFLSFGADYKKRFLGLQVRFEY